MPLTGCIDPEEGKTAAASITFLDLDNESPSMQIARGVVSTVQLESKRSFTVTPGPAIYLLDENRVHRVGALDFDATTTLVHFLALDTLRDMSHLQLQSGDLEVNLSLEFIDDGLGVVDGERAYDTIDYITSNYNNRWCASASLHEGGQNYEIAAEAMAEDMREMGFDFVEVTRYDDDPDQLNVVGYNWGRVNPDEYIVVGGHFDIELIIIY